MPVFFWWVLSALLLRSLPTEQGTGDLHLDYSTYDEASVPAYWDLDGDDTIENLY